MSRAFVLRLALSVVALVGLCLSCSGGSPAAERQLEQHVVTTSGEGACRTVVVEAAGSSAGEVVETQIDPAAPVFGYLITTPELVWWRATGSVDAHGHVDFVADEGTGGYDIVADPDRKLRAFNPSPGMPIGKLHVRSVTLTWTVRYVPARPSEPLPTIGIRVRVSPFIDGALNRCLAYSCDPETGPQTCPPLPEGTLCTDTNTCNGVETCDTEGRCRPGTNAAQGTPCIDDTVCNGQETCNGSGLCVPGTPLNCSSTDADGDDMPDAWEVQHGLSPTVTNGYEDADGDRYPNVFEYAWGTDPNDPNSYPSPTYTVNGAGGTPYPTVSAAVAAANTSNGNGAYQIIGIAPGVYKEDGNLNAVTIASSKPKLLLIGLGGAEKTIIDGDRLNSGWTIQNSSVVSSLTFRNTFGSALLVNAPNMELRFVDVLVRDNKTVAPSSQSAGLHVASAARVHVVGSTFLDNDGAPAVKQIYAQVGTLTLANTVVWGASSDPMVGTGSQAALKADYCLVKGQTLPGSGNLPGTTNPKLRRDARLRSDSPLRGAGGNVAQSRRDMDLEDRPSTAPDIGVDQFKDSDSDGLPDAWEIATAGSTGAIAGGADSDGDGLTNAQEYDLETNWQDVDSDGDGINDGVEVTTVATNPAVADSDDPVTDMNNDGVIDSIGAQLGYQPDQMDDDGDGTSNADEVLACTNPLRQDTDGDGAPDNTDKFPHDPLMSTLPSNPQDVTPPVITLTSPSNAIPQ